MSRIGKQPIDIPGGVDIKMDGNHIVVKGPKAQLELDAHPEMVVKIEDNVIAVERPSDQPNHRALHGLTRSLIANMIEGVTEGFQRTLEIQGVGYRAEKSGGGITLHLGYSHTISYKAPQGVEIELPNQTTVVIQGADKQAVGHAAAVIRGFRPPEPYKGKGVRYQGEHVRRKAGKTAGA